MNKQQEWHILKQTMPSTLTANCIEHEAPDFLAIQNGKTTLGIEITELFGSESDARLKKLPQYAENLISGKKHIHKDDIKHLKVEEVTITPNDGTPSRTVKGIFLEGWKTKRSFELLNETISEKAKKLQKYLTKAPMIDLIIVDRSNLFVPEKVDYASKILGNLETRMQIIKSGFREIHLVISLTDGKQISIPSKMNIFLEEVFCFEKALKNLKEISVSFADYSSMILSFLKARGFSECRVFFANKEIHVITNNAALLVAKGKKEVKQKAHALDLTDIENENTNEITPQVNLDIYKRVFAEASNLRCRVNIIQNLDSEQITTRPNES